MQTTYELCTEPFSIWAKGCKWETGTEMEFLLRTPLLLWKTEKQRGLSMKAIAWWGTRNLLDSIAHACHSSYSDRGQIVGWSQSPKITRRILWGSQLKDKDREKDGGSQPYQEERWVESQAKERKKEGWKYWQAGETADLSIGVSPPSSSSRDVLAVWGILTFQYVLWHRTIETEFENCSHDPISLGLLDHRDKWVRLEHPWISLVYQPSLLSSSLVLFVPPFCLPLIADLWFLHTFVFDGTADREFLLLFCQTDYLCVRF